MAFFKKLFSREHIFILGVIFASVFFAKFPTLYHWLHTPQGYWYPQQTSWFDAWDINVYVSYIRFGERVGLALQDTYTTIPHPSAYIYQFYTILGMLNRILHLDPFLLFHLSSIGVIIFLVLTCYFVTSIFIKDTFYRHAAFILTVLGGGFGWVSSQLGSLDTKIAGFTMVNAFERGHDGLSTILLLLVPSCLYLYITSSRKKFLFLGLVASIGSISIHPPLFLLYITLSLFVCIWHIRKTGKLDILIYPFFLTILFSIYYLLILSKVMNNPGFAGVGETFGANFSRINSYALILGLGVLTPFLFWEFIFGTNTKSEIVFLRLFFLTQLLFVFLPVGFNLYYTKGLHVWGVLLAIEGIRNFFPHKNKQTLFITLYVVVISLFTRIYIFNILMHPNINNSFFFLQKNEGDALHYIAKIPEEKSVLSLYRIGNYIPAFSNLKVYFGYLQQTPSGAEKLRKAELFYLSHDEKEQRTFLQQNNIAYIYYGLEEAFLRQQANLSGDNPFPYFPVLYRNDNIIVYEVDKTDTK